MTDAGSQDLTFTLLANKPGDLLSAICDAAYQLIRTHLRVNPIHLETMSAAFDDDQTGHRFTTEIGSACLYRQQRSCTEEDW